MLMSDDALSSGNRVKRSDLRPSQIQYQLLTAHLAIGDSYDSAEDAPDGVNEALEHIQTAMNLLGDSEKPLSEARPDSFELLDVENVHSELGERDWQDLRESDFVDIAESPIVGDTAFVFEHPEIGLHGFRWRQNSKTLEAVAFDPVGGGSDE